MRPGDPLVSVLIPAYDAEATLAACLRSVQRQTERRWECVVVDDGSRDGTGDVAERFARRDPRIRCIPCRHRGIVGALGEGLEACRGRYVARMDADDVMHGRRLELQVEMLERARDLSAVGCHVRLFPRGALGAGTLAYESWVNGIDSEAALRREAFVECPIAHPALMIRREVLSRYGYRDRGWPEDYDLILRLIRDGHRLSAVPRRLVGWRVGEGTLSRSDPAYRRESFVACKAQFLASTFLARAERYVLWGYGSTGRSLARALRAHGKNPAFIVEIHPGRIGNRILGAEVVPPERLSRLPRLPVIASVARAGPRERVRAKLRELGFRELVDFVCAA